MRVALGCSKLEVIMATDRRAEPRELLVLPLRLGDSLYALTRDISASGMYFEATSGPPLGDVLVLEMQHAHVKLAAIGEVVRIEHLAGRTGVAIKFRTPQLKP